MTVKCEITVTVNGQQYRSQVEPRLLLVHYLRDVLPLAGQHFSASRSRRIIAWRKANNRRSFVTLVLCLVT